MNQPAEHPEDLKPLDELRDAHSGDELIRESHERHSKAVAALFLDARAQGALGEVRWATWLEMWAQSYRTLACNHLTEIAERGALVGQSEPPA